MDVSERKGLVFSLGRRGKEGELPTFKFRELQAGVLGRLPQPQRGFGLLLDKTNVSDAGLIELGRLELLQTLGLNDTQVTDAGLKELAGLKSLQLLSLNNTQVTDVGMKYWPG